MAVIKGETVLGLGAAGCGDFKNPPAFIAAAFKYLLIEKEYKKYFKKVYFVIFKDAANKNIPAFKNVFGETMQKIT